MDKKETLLQAALDDIKMEAAVELAGQIRDDIDIIEIGTPFLMEYGMAAVSRMKELFPEKIILCDAKIMDAGSLEAGLAFKAGADIVTVLAVTDDLTIEDCAKAAHTNGGKLMADLICVEDIPSRVKRLEELGVDIIGIHTGVDQQAAGQTPLDDLKIVSGCVKAAQVSVAGGIKPETVSEYLKYSPDIVIAGGGIVNAPSPKEAAAQLKAKLCGQL